MCEAELVSLGYAHPCSICGKPTPYGSMYCWKCRKIIDIIHALNIAIDDLEKVITQEKKKHE